MREGNVSTKEQAEASASERRTAPTQMSAPVPRTGGAPHVHGVPSHQERRECERNDCMEVESAC